jgi:transposase
MRLMYSGRDFVRLYDRPDQLTFLDAHVRAFCYLGAFPQRIVYDNLSAVVKKIVGSERELTERLRRARLHTSSARRPLSELSDRRIPHMIVDGGLW